MLVSTTASSLFHSIRMLLTEHISKLEFVSTKIKKNRKVTTSLSQSFVLCYIERNELREFYQLSSSEFEFAQVIFNDMEHHIKFKA